MYLKYFFGADPKNSEAETVSSQFKLININKKKNCVYSIHSHDKSGLHVQKKKQYFRNHSALPAQKELI